MSDSSKIRSATSRSTCETMSTPMRSPTRYDHFLVSELRASQSISRFAVKRVLIASSSCFDFKTRTLGFNYL